MNARKSITALIEGYIALVVAIALATLPIKVLMLWVPVLRDRPYAWIIALIPFLGFMFYAFYEAVVAFIAIARECWFGTKKRRIFDSPPPEL